ncbi:MAG TPA: ATP-binding protein [Thermoanaerobaculia bacterium]
MPEGVLIFAPTGRDAGLTRDLLVRTGLEARVCADEAEFFHRLEQGAGAAILADEALSPQNVNRLLDVLGSEGPWSDLPLIVFTRRDSTDDVLATLEPLGNSTLLERPVRVNTLISAVRAALRARRRQYEVRDLLVAQAEADRRKDEFLAMLGHELRNPLAAIRNAHSVLVRLDLDDERAARQEEVIDRQTRHLARMVDDLLDVSRVTLGKIALKIEELDLEEVALSCLRELEAEGTAERRDLALGVATEPVRVQGDPVRLEQVISNLLQNAVKYTPSGGRISVRVRQEGEEAVVRVQDSGIGIPAEMLPHIFDLFTQVESSLSRSQGGLGLGLPLVRSLIELHGGRVTAASEGSGKGSEFAVRLPLARAAESRGAGRDRRRSPRAAAGVEAPEAPGGGDTGLLVLVVEDNPDGRESLRDLLEIWGHRVVLAEDGNAGLAQALATHPDVALIDIGLPGIDGNELARRIRATFNGDCPCLIAMTGYGQPEDRARALQAGFDTYLVKPVEPDTLSRLLAETRERRAAG